MGFWVGACWGWEQNQTWRLIKKIIKTTKNVKQVNF